MSKPLPVPTKLHLDKRASDIAKQGDGDDDVLLTEDEMAGWLKVSRKWLEAARRGGFGPPFVKILRTVRYPRGPGREWLRGRTFTSTRQYSTK